MANASGPHADSVNGVYELTNQMCGGLPVFQKKGSGGLWLEFLRTELRWSVVRTAERGTTTSYAFTSTGAGMCLPQDCPSGKWQVWMGSEGKQPDASVTVTLLSEVPSDTLVLVQDAMALYNQEVFIEYMYFISF